MATMSLSHDQAMRMQASARIYQQRYDDALSPWDMRAPAPVLGEPITEYRAKLAILAKKQLPPDHQLRKVQYRRMDTDIFDNFEPDLLQAVQRAAYDASSVPPGQFRKVTEVDSNGMKMVRWVGPESFVKQMTRPGRRVLSFNTSSGPMKCVAGGTSFIR
jgi:hypothetical protein